MNKIITEDQAEQLKAEGTEIIEIDGKELMAEIKKENAKKGPRKQVLRIVLEVGIPRADGNIDILTSENVVGITTDTLPSKLMAKIKPQLVDTLNKARAHVPSVVVQPKKPKIILPDGV